MFPRLSPDVTYGILFVVVMMTLMFIYFRRRVNENHTILLEIRGWVHLSKTYAKDAKEQAIDNAHIIKTVGAEMATKVEESTKAVTTDAAANMQMKTPAEGIQKPAGLGELEIHLYNETPDVQQVSVSVPVRP